MPYIRLLRRKEAQEGLRWAAADLQDQIAQQWLIQFQKALLYCVLYACGASGNSTSHVATDLRRHFLRRCPLQPPFPLGRQVYRNAHAHTQERTHGMQWVSMKSTPHTVHARLPARVRTTKTQTHARNGLSGKAHRTPCTARTPTRAHTIHRTPHAMVC